MVPKHYPARNIVKAQSTCKQMNTHHHHLHHSLDHENIHQPLGKVYPCPYARSPCKGASALHTRRWLLMAMEAFTEFLLCQAWCWEVEQLFP